MLFVRSEKRIEFNEAESSFIERLRNASVGDVLPFLAKERRTSFEAIVLRKVLGLEGRGRKDGFSFWFVPREFDKSLIDELTFELFDSLLSCERHEG